MKRLWRAESGAFYLIDDAIELPSGPLELQDLMGQRRAVQPEAIEPLEISEDQARAEAERMMTQVRDNAKQGLRTLRNLAHQAVDQAADLAMTTAALRAEATRPRADIDPGPILDQLAQALGAPAAQLRRLLDEDFAATAEGRAWFRQAAQAIHEGGGPDWTDAPHLIPARLRKALDTPEFAERLGRLAKDVASGSPLAREPDPS
ncbi:MAG: hypothetical protein EA397_18135 [Deltaproteobacteria bacterium]|nr:MAG: hypothetical protein EA397_18135 [Deltaproteobacteria bacterium]